VGIATQRAIALGPAANEAFARSTGPWAVLAAVIGRRAPNIRAAVISATIALWSATVAFYAVGGPPGNGGTPGLWLAAIVIIGPALGWLGKTSATTGSAGSLAVGVIAGWLIGEALHNALTYGAGHWYGAPSYSGAVGWHFALAQHGASRWLSVTFDAVAAACWVVAARGPKRIVAATLIPMTAAPAVSLTAAGLLLSSPLH